MSKRILSLVIATIMTLSCAILPAFADNGTSEISTTEINEKGQIVSVLGFLDGISPDAKITFYDYAKFLLEATAYGTNGHDEQGIISAALAQGYFYSTEAAKIKPSAFITIKEALFGAVRILGYKGIYPGDSFITGANRLKLTSGITKSYESTLTGADFYELAYNILHARYNNVIGVKAEKTLIYNSGRDVTILSELHNVYEDNGKITANNNTGLYSSDGGTGNDRIKIGDRFFNEGQTDAGNLIGHEVSFYYYADDSGELTLLYVKSEEDDVVMINSADIVGSDCTNKSIVFYDNDRKKEIRLASDVAVIKNGKAAVDYTKDDFVFATGDITVIGNHTVIIRKFTNHWIKAMDVDTYELRTRYGSIFDLNPNMNKVIDVIDKDGNPLFVIDLKAYDVMSISQSDDGNYVEIVRSTDAVTGKVTKKVVDGGRTVVTIDGKDYPVASDYINSTHSAIIPIINGLSAKFYLNAFGEISAVALTENVKQIGYVIAVSESGLFDTPYVKMYLPDENVIKDFKLAEKVKFDGGRKIDATNAYDKFLDTNGEFTNSSGIRRQIIGFMLNSDGQIIEVDLPSDGETGESVNSIKRSFNYSDYLAEDHKGYQYRSYSRSIGGKALTNGSKIIQVDPKNEAHDEDLYMSMTLVDQRFYRVEAYSLSQKSVTSDYICVYPLGGGAAAENYGFMVNYFYQGLDKDGMQTTYVNGIRMFNGMNDNAVMSIEVKSTVDVSGLDVGDVIHIDVDGQGRIMGYTLLYDYDKKELAKGIIDNGSRNEFETTYDWGAQSRYALYTIKRTQDGNALVSPGPVMDAVGYTELLYLTGFKSIPTYDPAIRDVDKRMFLGNINDIITYEDNAAKASYIFVATGWGECRYLINYLK